MYPLLAALVVLAVVLFVWRYLDGTPGGARTPQPERRPLPRPQRARRTPSQPTAPDDDPEFLRELRQRISKQKAEDSTEAGEDS